MIHNEIIADAFDNGINDDNINNVSNAVRETLCTPKLKGIMILWTLNSNAAITTGRSFLKVNPVHKVFQALH